MAFQDQYGKPALPKLTDGGAVPVDVADDDEAIANATLLELRAVRIGLELLNKLKPGQLIQLATAERKG